MDSQTAIYIGIAAMILMFALNRFLGERNFKQLATEEKLKLVDQFSTLRSLGTHVPLGILVVVMLAGRGNPNLFRWAFPLAVAAILIISVTLQILILRRLGTLALPDEYVSRFRTQAILVQICQVVALAFFAYGTMN